MPRSKSTTATSSVRRPDQSSGRLRELQAFTARRIQDIAGLTLIAGGAVLLLSMLTYHAADPSWNVAASEGAPVKNVLGAAGAVIADLFMQSFGFASIWVALFVGVWGGCLLRRRRLAPTILRLSAAISALFLLSALLAHIPAGSLLHHPWAGGPIGTALNESVLQWGPANSIWQTVAVSGLVILSGLLALYSLTVTRTGLHAVLTLTYRGVVRTSKHAALSCIWFTSWLRYHNSQQSRKEEPSVSKVKAPSSDQASAPLQIPPERQASAPEVVMPTQKRKTAASDQSRLKLSEAGEWELPDVDLLQEVPVQDSSALFDKDFLRATADQLRSVLEDFNIQGEITAVHPGPVVTLYELEPAPGTKSARVIGLADDIARSMAAVSVRAAVIPGRNVIGIEIPNERRQTVFMRELLEAREVDKTTAKVPLILGKDIGGKPVIGDLAKMPHLLIAGTTGSGKSVAVNTMILSLLYRLPPEKCRFIMIDPKMLELSVYDDIPHLLSPVVTEPGKAVVALKWTVAEMENRYRAMSKLGVRNIEGYNERLRQARKKGEVLMRKVQTGFDADTGKPVYEEQPLDLTELPYIVVIVDEFADLMLVAGKDVENAIQRLAQMARAAGIHLIMATQRPSVDVITGVIKANFPTRISFAVTSKIDSRTILGEGGAEQLLGMGDMLYMAGGGRISRVHGPFVTDEDVETVVSFLKTQGEPNYVDGVTEDDSFGDSEVMGALFGDGAEDGHAVDELYDQAVAIIASEGKASTSFIQRHLQIGYNRAARIIEEMERQGVVSKASPTGKREVLVSDQSGYQQAG